MKSTRSGFSKTSSQPGFKRQFKGNVSVSGGLHAQTGSPDSLSEQRLGEGNEERDAKARDALIDDLRKRVLTLSSQAKRLDIESFAAREKQIKQLQEDKTNLLKQIKVLESTVSDLQAQLDASDQKHQEAVQVQQLQIDTLTSECAQLHSDLNVRTDQVKTTKNDISQMSSIVQEITSLNSELNEKILRLNEEMEETNKRGFEATAKAQQYEELEKEFIEEKERGMRLEREVEEVSRWKTWGDSAKAVIKTVVEDLKTLETEEVRKSIEALESTFPPPSTSSPDSLSSLSTQLAHLKSELKDTKREFARVTKINTVQHTRISDLENEKVKLKAEMNFVIEKQKKQLNTVKENMRKMTEKQMELMEKSGKVASDLQVAQSKISNLIEKNSSLKTQLNESKRLEETLKNTIKSLKSELIDSKIDRSSYESSLQIRENDAKDAISRIKSLSEELWKRDNDLIRKETQRLRLQEEFNELKTMLQSSHVQFKLKMSEEMEKSSSELKEKEMEISQLRKMIAQGESEGKKKTGRSVVGRLEETWKQLKVMRDRSRNGSGEGMDRQVTDTLRARGHAALAALQRDTDGEAVVRLEETAGKEMLRDLLTSKQVESMTVQEILSEMKTYVDQSS